MKRTSSSDSREAPRQKMQFHAWVETAEKKRMPCVVLDISLKGARVRAQDLALPNEFTLLLDADSKQRRRCKVAWRRGFTLGLEFTETSAT